MSLHTEGKEYKICPECTFFCNVSEPDRYCSHCGTVLMDNCPRCEGRIENPFATFCKHCGTAYPGRARGQEW